MTRDAALTMLLILLIVASSQAGTKAPTPDPVAPEAKAARVVKEFPSYELMGRKRRNIVVAPNNSIEALAALARRLHAEDHHSAFEIFTDGNAEQFRRYMLWNLHYTKADSARYPYPKAWADRHAIALINLFALNWRERRWQLQMAQGNGVSPPVQLGYSVDLD